jgi:hypothetical protein
MLSLPAESPLNDLPGPTLVVLLRHFGCTFCRQAIADVVKVRDEICAAGASIAFIHASPAEDAKSWFTDPALQDAIVVSDPGLAHYRAFELGRTGPAELISPRVWVRGAASALAHGFGVQPVDMMRQLPGVFVVQGGRVLTEFRHQSPADRPDYVQLVRQALE